MFRLTIQKKITATLSVLIFITVLSLGLVINERAKEIVYSEVLRNDQESLSNIKDYYLHPYVQKMETMVEKWALDPGLGSTEANRFRPYPADGLPPSLNSITKVWTGFLTGNDEIRSIYYGSEKNGKLISAPSDIGLPSDYDARIRGWYQCAFQNPENPCWSSAYHDAGPEGEAVITVSKAVLDNGEPVGVAAMDIELSSLAELIRELDMGQAGYLMVLSNEGIVYAHPNPNLLNRKAGSYPWLSHILTEKSGADYFFGPDSEYTYSFLTIPETGWKIVSIKPVSVNGILANIRIWILGSAVIAALIAILVAQFTSRHMLKPLKSMMSVIARVSSGDTASRMDIRSKDEFQVLGSEFNGMLDRLMLRKKEIIIQKEEIQALHEETEAMNENLTELLQEIEENYLMTVRALANAIEASDSYTRGHCDRVGSYALKLAERLKLSDQDIMNLTYASMLHDVGKIGISESILNKTTKLSEAEFDIIRSHPQIGHDILMDVSFLEECRTILLQHHERVDGKGYPGNLKGDAINPLAKILAIADSYDAMTSARAYRNIPLSTDEALDQLIGGKGTQYDGDMVDVFTRLIEEECQISLGDMAL